MESNNKSEDTDCCSEVIDEDKEDLLQDYEVTAEGKYRCRDCGMLFDTLEAHDEHHRTVHGQVDTFPTQGMTM